MTYDQKKMEEIIKDLDGRFKNHRVYLRSFINSKSDDHPVHRAIEEFHWTIPGDGNFSCTYLLRRNGLIVYGDLGEAAYVWPDFITPEFVAHTDYTYFIGKHQGIDGHVKLYEWDPKRVESEMKDFVQTLRSDRRKGQVKALRDWRDSSFSEQEWQFFVHDHEDLHHSEAYDWGRGIHFRAMCHWYGFKLAFKQFQESKSAEAGL